MATVTYGEALDVALCNRGHVARLTAAGRMTPHGQRHVDAARADGRWERDRLPTTTRAVRIGRPVTSQI